MDVISFQPRKRIIGKNQIRGYIWVDQETKAIARFFAESLSEKNITELEMDWTLFKNYWFPKQQRFRMDGGQITYPSVRDTLLEDGTVRLDTIRKRKKFGCI